MSVRRVLLAGRLAMIAGQLRADDADVSTLAATARFILDEIEAADDPDSPDEVTS